MKKNILLALLAVFLFTTSQLTGQLTWSPEKIMGGDEVAISYAPQGTPLENEKTIVVNLYQLDEKSIEVEEIAVEYKDGKFTGTFKVDAATKALLFGLSDEDLTTFDSRDKKGYKTICYQADRKTPVAGAYVAKAKIVCEYAEIVGAKLDSKKGLKLLDKEFKTHPASAKNIKFQNFHLGLASVNKNEEALKVHEKLASDILAKENPSEAELEYIYKYTGSVKKDKGAAEKIKNQIIANHPENYFAVHKLSGKVRTAKEVSEKIAVLDEWNKKFGDDPSKNSTKNYIISKIVTQYGKAGDWDNFRKYLKMIDDPGRKAMILNSTAWPMSGENIDAEATTPKLGQQLSKESLELLEVEMKEMTAKSKIFTPRQYLNRLKYSYGSYADTYALLAYKNNQLEEALAHQLIACEQNNFENGEMNENYCFYFEKIKSPKETEALIASLIEKGKATAKMEAQHKRLFMANNSLDSAYEKYVTHLKKSAHELMRSTLKSEMINTPAPSFNLVNLKGDKITLDKLKGKVVVVDFWATWCRPCTASFPGMQKAVNKFTESDDVEFVFIDTWESGDDVHQKVSNFISKNNYSFQVLMDLDAKVVSDFGVSGIPTKFIIDKNGMIKFRSGGFNGNDEELVDELTMMIELAGGTIPN